MSNTINFRLKLATQFVYTVFSGVSHTHASSVRLRSWTKPCWKTPDSWSLRTTLRPPKRP